MKRRDLDAARVALLDTGFEVESAQGGFPEFQEVWRLTENGFRHTIDLHWAAFNSTYLDKLLPVNECFSNSTALPRLSPYALRLTDVYLLLHICIHRDLHRTAPYFSQGIAYFGGDRLVWANDIATLSQRFTDKDWRAFTQIARDKQVARAMAAALAFAESAAVLKIPPGVMKVLRDAGKTETASKFLLDDGRRVRALTNFMSAKGWRARARHFYALLTPPDDALHSRYPRLKGAPRSLLLLIRLFDFAVGRGTRNR